MEGVQPDSQTAIIERVAKCTLRKTFRAARLEYGLLVTPARLG